MGSVSIYEAGQVTNNSHKAVIDTDPISLPFPSCKSFPRRRGSSNWLIRHTGWIPACAGMTALIRVALGEMKSAIDREIRYSSRLSNSSREFEWLNQITLLRSARKNLPRRKRRKKSSRKNPEQTKINPKTFSRPQPVKIKRQQLTINNKATRYGDIDSDVMC